MTYAITITRQFGSLGRPIAKRMAEILGIKYYDRDIVDQTAQKMKLSVKEVSNAEETASSGFFRMKFPLGNTRSEIQDNVFRTQSQIIRDLADKQNAIFVGRCSDYVLRKHADCLNIFIYSSYENRYQNCVDTLLMSPNTARKMIRDVDGARERYHLNYTGRRPEDPLNKDILINSNTLGVQGTAEFLCSLARRRFDLE